MPPVRRVIAVVAATTLALGVTLAVDAQGAPASAPTPADAPSHAYRAHDYADGQAMSILPPGENGLVNATDAALFLSTGQRPFASDDQLGKYANLLYGYHDLTDSNLSDYYDDESFGVLPADITRTEAPETGVTIYRDTARRPAHLRRHEPDAGLRRGVRAGRGPAVPDGRAAALRRGIAGVVPRWLVRVRADGPRPVAARSVHEGTGHRAGRRAAGGVRRAGRPRPLDDLRVRRRRERLHPARAAESAAAAGRLRRRGAAGAAEPLERRRRRRDRRADRRDLRTGGGAEISNAHLLQYLQQTLGTSRRQPGVQGLPHRERPARADDGRRQVVPVRDPGPDRPVHDGTAGLQRAGDRRPGRTRRATVRLSAPNPTAVVDHQRR